MAPPVGIALNSEDAVGAKLGQGAFGQVHVVTRNNVATAWACKLTAVPTKATKKKNSEPEVARHRLYTEYLLYKNQLLPLCGTMIPKLPTQGKDGLSNRYDDVEGYSVLVMELMQGGLLFDALPKLVSSCKNADSIDLGPIAHKLMEIIAAIHNLHHLVVDVKPDNLMLTSLESSSNASGKKKKASAAANVTPQSIADCLRMIDFGLAKCYKGPHGHKPNDGGQPLQGTPLYCSLNAHAGDTISRRDDVEATLYVIGDMVRTVTALASNSSSNNKKKTPPSGTTTLPWSNEKSDEAIGKAKKQQVLDRKSSYYSGMPKSAADILFSLLQEVRSCKYTGKPDYPGLCARLDLLEVPLAKTTPAATKKKAPPRAAAAASNRKGTSRRATRSRAAANLDGSDDDEDESPPAARQKTTHSKDDEFDSDVSMDDAANDDGEESVTPMEVDSGTEDEVEEVEAPMEAASKKFFGIKLLVSDPKQPKTTTIYLVRGAKESIELKNGHSAATLTLSDNKHGGVSVLSTGKHKKECPAKVDNTDVPLSGTVAFWSQTVTIGNLKVKIKQTTKSEYKKSEGEKKPAAKTKKAAAAAAGTTSRSTTSRTTRSAMKDTDDNVEKKPAVASKKKNSFVVTLTHRNSKEQFMLEQGETATLGSAPKGKGKKVVVPGLPASLVRLDLDVQEVGCMVKVTNLQSKQSSSSNIPVRLNTTPIAPGAWQAAFPGTRVMLGGDTTLTIA